MSTVGQIEKKTQDRVVNLFRDTLGYEYLGNWANREDNANIESKLLRAWLNKQGVPDALVTRALHLFGKAAGDTSKSLYDRNRAVCLLARMARSLLVIERLLLALLESGRTTASRAASSDTAKGAATRTRPWGG